MPDQARNIVEEARGILEEAHARLERLGSPEELERLRVRYLGRKGAAAQLFDLIGRLPAQLRPAAGKCANELKSQLTSLLEKAEQRFPKREQPRPALLDPTLPGRRPPLGSIHPLTKTIEQIAEIFRTLGFSLAEGPEVELSWYNFEALNIPPDHPSRDDFDTFYLTDEVLLRSQTSTVQIRTMEKTSPPVRIIAPGRCFRPDTEDARHSSMFHQVEGLMVDEGVSFGDLKAVLHLFARALFSKDVEIRFRPSYFPFTEPSAEVDFSCVLCGGQGCSTCSYSGWLEIGGAGMVDPNVFEAVGYDSERYTGFAFGVGVERMAMIKYGVNDIRLFFQGDKRFLDQF